VWVPNCATGEEAYSFAIAFHEFVGRRTTDIPIQIFATDPSTQAVVRARTGIYSPDIAHEVSPHRLRRFFVKSDDRYQICRPIRDLCIFARQNLMTDSPFSRMDIVVFRSPLNCFITASQEKVIRALHYSIKPKGLFLLSPA